MSKQDEIQALVGSAMERFHKHDELVGSAIERFHGHSGELVSAVGMLLVGQFYGWRVMRLVISRQMWKRYREIFDVPDLKELMLERGPLAHRSNGLKLADDMGRYWDLVKGLCGVSLEQKGIIERRQVERLA